MGFFDKLKEGLSKTRDSLAGAVDDIVHGRATIDDEMFDDLEETLVMADIGFDSSMAIIDDLRDKVAKDRIRETDGVIAALKEIMAERLLTDSSVTDIVHRQGPTVLLVIGVNGVGKTTTIAKIANYLKGEGKSVLLCAGDTFRAAAIDQIQMWADRVGVPLVKKEEGSDPASVVFDGIQEAKNRSSDVLIIDTAGRLHNKKNLMKELEKIHSIIEREYGEAYLESLLVLDASTGQNAVLQAKAFNEVTKMTGLVLTKLDGTAKGGVVYPLQYECQVPVQWIGVGEGMDDLRPFDPKSFVEAIFS
ncbi:signal recognition particle-docking protein FtsY [Kallipyga gabonensis]|uniref:signal recognition particle-docking protein FtsY n=1 Tax=Kallipyga gabonensis TaxID=1686287 RepID=UPI0006B5EE2C|nr:signal recognition particle-docking protein FtsY [Kallipyga gabonensis]